MRHVKDMIRPTSTEHNALFLPLKLVREGVQGQQCETLAAAWQLSEFIRLVYMSCQALEPTWQHFHMTWIRLVTKNFLGPNMT